MRIIISTNYHECVDDMERAGADVVLLTQPNTGGRPKYTVMKDRDAKAGVPGLDLSVSEVMELIVKLHDQQ